MKIVQVISNGYITGGAEKCAAVLSDALRVRGHEVLVLASDEGNPTNQETCFSNVTFPSIYNKKRSFVADFFVHLWYPKSHAALQKVVRDFRPDVVHFHTLDQLTPSALFAVGKVPAVHTVHSATVYTASLLKWAYPQIISAEGVSQSTYDTFTGKMHAWYNLYIQRPLYKLGFRYAVRRLIAPSKYMADILAKEAYGVPVQQIYNGVHLPHYFPLRHKNRILFVGRLDPSKGAHLLVEALTRVLKSVPHGHLDIVGDGSARSQLVKQAHARGLDGHITFHGWLSGDDLARAYQQTTVVAIPSIWPENLPTVCIEALAYGRPVVGSDKGGMIEMVQEGVTGRIVPPDALSLSKAIISVLTDKNLDKISGLCAHSAERFRVAEFVDNHEKLYEEVRTQRRAESL